MRTISQVLNAGSFWPRSMPAQVSRGKVLKRRSDEARDTDSIDDMTASLGSLSRRGGHRGVYPRRSDGISYPFCHRHIVRKLENKHFPLTQLGFIIPVTLHLYAVFR